MSAQLHDKVKRAGAWRTTISDKPGVKDQGASVYSSLEKEYWTPYKALPIKSGDLTLIRILCRQQIGNISAGGSFCSTTIKQNMDEIVDKR